MKAKRRRIKDAWCASEPEKEQGCRMKLQEMETEGRGGVQTGAVLPPAPRCHPRTEMWGLSSPHT